MLRPWQLEIAPEYEPGKPVYLQIADKIIADIKSGRLKSGNPLPGSRVMARLFQVNRNTLVEALNVLLNEGWLVARERKGTFVADQLPALAGRRGSQPTPAEQPVLPPLPQIRFDDGHPDSRIAPATELARAYRHIFNRKARWQMMGYGHELGDAAFRRAIAQMLNHQRGMQLQEQHLCITRGSQMAMYLTAQCLPANSSVIIEHPGYKPAWKALEHAGLELLPVRVDNEGLVIEDVLAHLLSGKKISALYTTPHRQYPTTVTLSLPRRMQLIQLSNQYGFTIIEDDYDNEFHFGYRPVLPLASFPQLKHYVYIGTMSKVVAPALRIGYLATNSAATIEQIGTLRKIIDVQSDTFMEQAVLELINDGTIKRHLKKATLHYKTKRDLTADLLQQHLSDKVNYTLPEGGLAFWLQPLRKTNWKKAAGTLTANGIHIITPDNYSLNNSVNGIRLSYGALTLEQLETGIKALASVL